MAHITSFFMLHILLVFLTIATTKGDDKLITSVCTKTQDASLCNRVLRADPRSAKSDLKGLGFIAIDIAQKSAQLSSGLVVSLLNSATDPKLKSLYATCKENYATCIQNLVEVKQALTKDDIVTFWTRATGAYGKPATCQDGFDHEGPPPAPPKLKQLNEETKNLCSIVVAVGAVLNGKAN